jgi:hypothetical protein
MSGVRFRAAWRLLAHPRCASRGHSRLGRCRSRSPRSGQAAANNGSDLAGVGGRLGLPCGGHAGRVRRAVGAVRNFDDPCLEGSTVMNHPPGRSARCILTSPSSNGGETLPFDDQTERV